MSEDQLQIFKKKYGIFLDPQQEAAAFSPDRHVLLLAVPGSGKTTVMVARLGYLTHVLGVAPSSVLAITYSVAGTAEMRHRYIEKFGDDGIEIRTIHGFCVSVINEYCYRKNTRSFKMLSDEDGQESIVRRILCETGGYPSDSDVRDAVNAISYAVNAMLSDEEISKLDPLEGRVFSEVFGKYRNYKLENELMDFDDQLKFAYTILLKHPDICAYCAGRFRHVCVDEAQDTSLLQHRILHRIAEYSRNLFMVGDEDQSIYGFRAASPYELLKFGQTYPDAKVFF
ncbi:MAG: UvrD-helicase domain-containing protein, partial [Clostridia bacterium]|nr:UvrD-helicase domain-containing protein [Clostridia bacterium]